MKPGKETCIFFSMLRKVMPSHGAMGTVKYAGNVYYKYDKDSSKVIKC